MWQWLQNGKLTSAIGFLILIALTWTVGPYAGLASRDARFAVILGIMLLWVVTLMTGRLLSQRAGAVLEKVLRGQADDAVMGASPDRRAEVNRLRQRMLAAIDTLKTSKLGKTRGKAALYELPWYMIIGHPAAGKSSAILHSGLTFPFGDKQAVQGVGGTRDCDWFFTSEGVLLDTAGRYATQREDRGEWLTFLKLLKKYRSKAPVNGILVAISFPELVQFRSEQFSIYARQVRERIAEIDDTFGVKVPIYLIFTKIDLLGGFAHFFDDLNEEQRQQVWGATLAHDQGSDFDAKRAVCQQFDALYRGLVQLGTEKLANNRENMKRPSLFAFPIEFNGMREAVGKFVELLFQDDPYHSRPLLRGFYFTSALQEGSPRITAGSRVSAQFDLSRSGFDAAHPPTSNSFFLRNLFRDVLFPDQHLISTQLRTGNTRLRAAAIVAALLVLGVATAGLTWSYIGNAKLIAAAKEELGTARGLMKSAELSDRLKALQVLQLRLEQLYAYRNGSHPLALGLSLYQGGAIERALRAEYFDGIQSLMLGPVVSSLERTLTILQGQSGATIVAEDVKKAPADSSAGPKNAAPTARPTPEKKRTTRVPSSLPVIPISDAADPVVRGAWSVRSGLRGTTPASHATNNKPSHLQASDAAIPSFIRVSTAGAKSPFGGSARPQRPAVNQDESPVTLEDSYNALKTYLMLEHRERMETSHLADQIPKHWRRWLHANKGSATTEDINHLAERVVAFYISQIAESDLPLIDNRQDLVATSREVLRGALQRMPAKERVYNELKSRANTQFSPMTVPRILNNPGFTVAAGSYAIPGAFTREAWEKYFRNAFREASRGEVKGDDWVLASATLDNLGNDGDAERTRLDLEALYMAEYAREWKKFLQGVAIQDFGTLDSATQAIGQLSDQQNSAIKLILAKAVYETAWDNPSQLSSSIQSAKSSVIERTEKLLLGNDPVPVAENTAKHYGELGAKFAGIAKIMAPADGGRFPLSAYFEALSKLRGKLSQLVAAGEPDLATRQLLEATLNGSNSELADALTVIDAALLANASEETKEIVRPLLVRPLVQTFSVLIPGAERDINRAWQNEVMGQWRGLSNKYPFADSTNEATLADIGKFLKPGEGVLPRFVEKHLTNLLTKRGDTLVPRKWANLGVNFNPAFLASLDRLASLSAAVLNDGESTKFEVQPVPTPGMREILLEVDGQVLTYRNGPQPWTVFTWPNAANTQAQGARIQVVSFAGVSTTIASFHGRLGLMRLLAQGRVDNPASATVQLEWRLKKDRGASVEPLGANSRAEGSSTDTDLVRFNFRAVSGPNPLVLSTLRRASLPEKVTN